MRRKPYSEIHLHQIQNSHNDLFNLQQQELDDGSMKDRQGRTVDFKNTEIVKK